MRRLVFSWIFISQKPTSTLSEGKKETEISSWFLHIKIKYSKYLLSCQRSPLTVMINPTWKEP